MCFSALSSFIGGGVLTAIGTGTILQNKEPDRRLFAAIPFVFGVQQLSEGVVWLTLPASGHEAVLHVARTVFLIAAGIVWPTVVPLSMLLMEKVRIRRTALWAMLAVGVATSLAHFVGMLTFTVHSEILGFHIRYSLDSPVPWALASMIGYLVATLVPLYVSSHRRMIWFAVIVTVAYAVTQIFYQEFLVSVWCFFAALASASIWWIQRVPGPIAEVAAPVGLLEPEV